MIVAEKKNDVVISGEFETSEFEVDDSAFIFDLLSNNIYTHKVRAVIRELACNAQDSHTLAGQEGKFEIHLPTFSNSVFWMRDYGTGLSEESVRKTYCAIGKSTKRKSNLFTGCLGIGSLSPYSIADSFYVTSYIDGVCYKYLCYRDENRKGQVSLLSKEETSAPNGLKVSVDVSSEYRYDFKREAIRVLKHFDQTPQINDSSVVDAINEIKESREVFNGLYYLNNTDETGFVAIMGNVEYNIPKDYNKYNLSGGVYFKMGSLSFNPGREELSLDADSIAVLTDTLDKVYKSIVSDILIEVETETDTLSKIIKFYSYKNSSAWNILKDSEHSKKYQKLGCTTEITSYTKERYGKKVEKNETSFLPVGDKIAYFANEKGYHNRIRYNIKEGVYKTIVILTPEQIKEMDIAAKHVQSLSSLDAPERIKNIGTKSKVFRMIGTDYSYREDPKNNWSEEAILDSEEKVYIEINRYKPVHYTPYALDAKLRQLLKFSGKQPEIYGIKTSHIGTRKFKAQNWISLRDYMKRETAHLVPVEMNDQGIDWLQINYLSKLSDDKDIKFMVNNKPDNEDLVSFLESLGREIKTDNSLQDCLARLTSKYPMIFNQNNEELRKYMKDINDRPKTT